MIYTTDPAAFGRGERQEAGAKPGRVKMKPGAAMDFVRTAGRHR